MTDLLLVGSDRIFRQALAILVEDSLPGCHVRAQTGVLAEALALLASERSIAGAIVDLHGRDEDPVGLVAALHRHHPRIVVLALIEPSIGHLASQLHEAGAAQGIDKSGPLTAILDGVGRLCSASAGRARHATRW